MTALSPATTITDAPVYEPTTEIDQMPDGRYRVLWSGHWWGGSFLWKGDAYLCSAWCEAQCDDDRLAWVDQNERYDVREGR